MRILSLHFGHHSSACIYADGKIEKYILTERITKIKHDSNILTILNFVDDLIKQNQYVIDYIILSSNISPHYILKNLKSAIGSKLIIDRRHHSNHAAISFFNSGFEESLIIVVDGHGSFVDKNKNLVEVESVFWGQKNKLKVIYKNIIEIIRPEDLPWLKKFSKKKILSKNFNFKLDYKNIFGIGILYDIAAILTGNTEHDCGKVMGLSSYGEENNNFKNIFLQGNTLNKNFYKESSEEIKYFLKNPIKKITKNNYKIYADFCYEVQQQTQKAVGDLIEKYTEKTNIKNVCISGGYGMNVVANYYYLQRFPNINFYFEPMCNDSGISIGSAILNYINLSEENVRVNPIKTTSFHGIEYDISHYKGKTVSIKDIVDLLFNNKSVAVYNKLAESGQRALGNRSIFFNALCPDAKNIVNTIKRREWYRPFAAMVLEEDANIYFDMGKIKSSPYMTICFPVRSEYVKIIPGVIHVDNTCRIQTVSKDDNYLYNLLIEFKNLSGHGVLLNTSFNLAGEPLVETPKDAFNTFNNSCLDYLWFKETNQLFKTKYKYV